MHNVVRSNDMMLGCPFDVLGFAILQCILAQVLHVKPGVYTHSISNAHIYENHFDGARELIQREVDHGKISLLLPPDSYMRACAEDETLIEDIYQNIVNQYYPLSEIKGLEITI